MNPRCPQLNHDLSHPKYSESLAHGQFVRKSDSKTIKRWKCTHCNRTFSSATHNLCFGQNKRRVNSPLARLLSESTPMRACARILKINRKTVARKLIFLGEKSKKEHHFYWRNRKKAKYVQFDDLITSEKN